VTVHYRRNIEAKGRAGSVTVGILLAIVELMGDVCGVVGVESRIELCGEIDDEDTSLVERAEERADRFVDYKDSLESVLRTRNCHK
jgi:hypothetical protein